MTDSRPRGRRQAEAERNDRALLQAAREFLAADGAHASVAAIAARAGVGIGSLYRRYRTKEELFQRLSALSLDHWNAAAERGLAADARGWSPSPWTGCVPYTPSRRPAPRRPAGSTPSGGVGVPNRSADQSSDVPNRPADQTSAASRTGQLTSQAAASPSRPADQWAGTRVARSG